MSIHQKLAKIQSELFVPKGKENKFGGYAYRSCEDILKVVKPLCFDNGCSVFITNEMITVGAKVYCEATVTLTDWETGESVVAKAQAREAEARKGMDDSQVTGSTSSYARKYALAGLFGIDNEKDPDATNDHGKGDASAKPETKPAAKQASAKYKQAWLAYKAKSHNDDPDAVKANFKKLVEATVKKSDMNSVTDDEWDTVMDLIVTD